MKVELRVGSKSAITSALVNTGYEVAEPEIHVPAKLAAKLGLNVRKAPTERYAVVGAEVEGLCPRCVEVRVVASEISPWVRARAVSVAGESEVILSDRLCEELGIELVRV